MTLVRVIPPRIEVANGDSYYPEAQEWALEKNLTMLGNSDIHGPALQLETSPENHRTMTLVFVREKSAKALEEALVEGRTAVWFKNQLIGRKKYLDAIFEKSVEIRKPYHKSRGTIWIEIRNHSDIDMDMERAGKLGPGTLMLPANATTVLKTKVDEGAEKAELSYVVRNFGIAPEKGVHTAIEALGRLSKSGRDGAARLSLIGSGDPTYVGWLREEATRWGVEDGVVFRGRVDQENMPSTLREFDALLFTSTWSEPFGRVIIEAMASGLTLVASRAGATSEIAAHGHDSLLFAPGDAAELADRIARLVDEPAVGERLAQAARRSAIQRFSMASSGRQV